MRHEVEVRGGGRVELAAYGMADAEHQVEKEIHAAWPGARVSILEVARTAPGERIVEEFTIRYRVSGVVLVDVEVESPDQARRAALRALRERFDGTRFGRIVWDAG
jgi:outer membrane PBP1 activator LpoA protein